MNDLITLPAIARRQVDQLASLNIGQMTAQAHYLYGGVGGEGALPRINQRISHHLSAAGASSLDHAASPRWQRLTLLFVDYTGRHSLSGVFSPQS